MDKDYTQFWKSVKKINSFKTVTPTVIDDASDPTNISSLFAAQYDSLYNSVPYNSNEMDDFVVSLSEKNQA